jgi:hypothetical protein
LNPPNSWMAPKDDVDGDILPKIDGAGAAAVTDVQTDVDDGIDPNDTNVVDD